SGALTFNPGDATKTINVTVNADAISENDETFFVNLSSAVAATIADGQALGTIHDNSPLPALSINNVSQNEGNSGTTTFNFTVTLSPASGRTVTVNYNTANATATAPSDYTATSGTLTFNPGDTTKTITVTVNGDATLEIDETFFVNLSAAVNANITDNQGQGTIVNDDGTTISVNNEAQNEGNSGTTSFIFTVT